MKKIKNAELLRISKTSPQQHTEPFSGRKKYTLRKKYRKSKNEFRKYVPLPPPPVHNQWALSAAVCKPPFVHTT